MTEYKPSIVEHCPREKRNCGYCSSTGRYYSFGLFTYTLTVEDYQDMIDRGWRRCGKYCYKPVLDISCCPLYTIRCAAKDFKLSKTQKKILKRFNNFLLNGTVSSNKFHKTTEISQPMEVCALNFESKNIIQDNSNKIAISSVNSSADNIIDSAKKIQAEKLSNKPTEVIPASTLNKQESTSKNKCMKAKQLRIERKKQKLQKLGLSEEEISKKLIEKKRYPVVKTIEDFFQESVSESAVHKLKDSLLFCGKFTFVTLNYSGGRIIHGVLKSSDQFQISLVRSCPRSVEFINTFEVAFDLYKRYQRFIHKDAPEKLTQNQFERFLVNSPLQIKLVLVKSPDFKKTFEKSALLFAKYQKAIHQESDEDCDIPTYQNFLIDSPLEGAEGYGSYHQQYWLDDKLIAVGVIDILPKCVSSVYFFYDPDYSYLSLGTYGALREIELTRKLSNSFPDLTYYYMGFYIHSCVKMKYKGAFKPSYLLCPEVYTWHLIQECLPKIEKSKYSRLNEDPNARDVNSDVLNSDILVLYNRTIMTFEYYLSQKEFDPKEYEEVMEYAKLIGKPCAKRMLLYRE